MSFSFSEGRISSTATAIFCNSNLILLSLLHYDNGVCCDVITD